MEDKVQPNKYHNLKNKLIYVICFSTMLAILGGVYYICFFREIHVDLTKNIEVRFIGENGSGEVQITRHDMNYNQRIEPFYESLSVSFSENNQLSNGDEVTIVVQYDGGLADKFNIVVDESELVKTVEGLAQRFASKDEIPQEYLDQLSNKSTTFMKKDESRILDQDFTFASDVKLLEETMIQRVFLKAEDAQIHDKIIDIYKMQAEGKRENGDMAEETIYYMVVFDDINSNLTITDNQMYGEKALYTEENLGEDEGIINYFKNKYLLSYRIELFE